MPLPGYDAKRPFLFQGTSSLVIEAWLSVLNNFMQRRHTTLYAIVIRIFFIKLLAQFLRGLLLAKCFGVWDGRIMDTQYSIPQSTPTFTACQVDIISASTSISKAVNNLEECSKMFFVFFLVFSILSFSLALAVEHPMSGLDS